VALGALVVNVPAARALGPAGRGALALHLQITYIVSAVLLLGRDRSFLATVAEGGSLRSSTRQMISLLAMPLTLSLVVSVALGLAFHSSVEGKTAALVSGYVLVVTGIMLSRFDRSVAIAASSPWYFTGAVLASQISLIGTSVALLASHVANVTTWFLAYGLTMALPFVCSVLVSLHGKGALDLGAGTNRAARKLGMRLLPSVIGEMALLRADRLLIPLLASYYELGIYVVAATMTELASWPLLQYIDSQTRGWVTRFVQGTLSPWRVFASTSIFSVCLSAAVAIPAYIAIPLLFGSDYREAQALIPILSVATALFGISRVAIGLATVAGVAHWPGWINGAGLISSLASCVLLIPRYGALGASYASLISYGVCAGLALVAVARLSRLTGLELSKPGRESHLS
jgi:O-antigen/teichoic acid export membrane protein